jgi:LPS-assembly protein
VKKDLQQNNSSTRWQENKTHVGFLILLVSGLLPAHTLSADESLCKFQPASIINKDTFSLDGKTHLQSDKVEVSEKDVSRFEGHVVIQQIDKRIETEQAEYKKQTEQIEAKGNVRFITPDIQVKSETANFDLKSNHALLQKTEYQSLTSRAHGQASKVEIKNSHTSELSDATYTTCDPDDADWLLSASSITLNNKSHQGHARHVVIRFKDVPFFYFPYLRFPIGENRLSGFLFPYFGNSDQHGNELKIPYYWNIHPQFDATITPWYMSKRGTLLHTEFRYLSESSNGTLTAEYLDKDKVFKGDRERLHWKHQSAPKLGWQTNIEYNSVADISHLTDFTDNINSTSATYLIKKGDISYNSPKWLLNIKAQNHQIISGDKPYKRLPQISLNSRYAVKNNALNYSFQSEAVRFDHADYKVIGERVHIKPGISYPLSSAAGFFKPQLSVQYTDYNLQQTSGETKLSRTVPTFSLNSGLFFERDSKIFSNNYIHTLEPQLFYVYVPYKDQSALPIFDTSVYAFNINQPFANYRFNGIDRIGDDNRLTAALATRFINQENGQETFMARVGQIYYFSDRKVQLPTVPVDTGSRSNMIAEVKTKFNIYGNWSLSSQLEWDPELKENASSSSQLGYKYKKFNLNFAHRYQRNTLETREMKMNWELSSRWKINAAHLYNIRDKYIVENLFGINYESCCWGLRLSTKERYLNSTETDRGVYLELILKGLGGFGIL